jgi:hypothetical protein
MKVRNLLGTLVIAGLVLGVAHNGVTQQQNRVFKNFVILIDQSSDMNVNYMEKSKNFVARDVAKRLLNNLAAMKKPVQGAIYEYGIQAADNENRVLRVEGWKDINKHATEFQLGVDKCQPQTGPSVLSVALRKLLHDMQNEPVVGWTAVFILSAGNFTDVEKKADVEDRAKELKQSHPELCIYTIQIGPNDKGQDTLEGITSKGKCGYHVNADSLSTGLETQNYITGIFK